MKRLSYCLIVLGSLVASCKKSDTLTDVPECVRATINANKDNSTWGVGSVEEYRFDGALVYAFNPDNSVIADGTTMVQTDNCNTLCFVGGFGGPNVMLCNGKNFYQNAVLVRRIWEKK